MSPPTSDPVCKSPVPKCSLSENSFFPHFPSVLFEPEKRIKGEQNLCCVLLLFLTSLGLTLLLVCIVQAAQTLASMAASVVPPGGGATWIPPPTSGGVTGASADNSGVDATSPRPQILGQYGPGDNKKGTSASSSLGWLFSFFVSRSFFETFCCLFVLA